MRFLGGSFRPTALVNVTHTAPVDVMNTKLVINQITNFETSLTSLVIVACHVAPWRGSWRYQPLNLTPLTMHLHANLFRHCLDA